MTHDSRDASDRSLGLDVPITRQDFLNGVLLGAGALLLGAPAPAHAALRGAHRAADGTGAHRAADPAGAHRAPDPWTGYGGIGDYASANGNTRPVLDAAHRIRDGAYESLPPNAVDTGEIYDVIVVGGGIAGLTAAYTVAKSGPRRCLVLENHAIFGGEARQNEFLVDGVRLVAPQASNQFAVPREGAGVAAELWDDLGLPREFRYAELPASVTRRLRVPLDHYAPLDGVAETQVDVGYFFDEQSGAKKPTWLRNIWRDDLKAAPFPAAVKKELVRWRTTSGEGTDEFRRHLDTISYAQLLEDELGFPRAVTEYVTPIIGLINGASPDAVSAYAAAQIGMPGAARVRPRTGPLPQSFPGGNATVARHLVKYLVPDAIAGPPTADGVFDGGVRFDALDRPGLPTRIRLGATVVRVEHARRGRTEGVTVAYEQNGRVYRVHARAAVLASPGNVNRLVVADLPAPIRRAYDQFHHAPAMVANVALTNWRFLHKLGAPACRWFDGEFGFACNIRRPMRVGDQTPPFHPDRPAVLTFYLGLYEPGLSAAEQGAAGRARLLEASYADYERRIRHQMVRLFSDAGFDPRRDVAGIVLNRWGHARVLQPPGFHFGRDGEPAPREVVQRGFDRIAIGHAELNGHQTMTGAMAQGRRAAERALEQLD